MSELPVDAGAPSACFIQVLFFPCPWLAWRTGLCPAAPVRLARPALTPALTLETGHIQVLCTGRWFDACYRTWCFPLTPPPPPANHLLVRATRAACVASRESFRGVCPELWWMALPGFLAQTVVLSRKKVTIG